MHPNALVRTVTQRQVPAWQGHAQAQHVRMRQAPAVCSKGGHGLTGRRPQCRFSPPSRLARAPWAPTGTPAVPPSSLPSPSVSTNTAAAQTAALQEGRRSVSSLPATIFHALAGTSWQLSRRIDSRFPGSPSGRVAAQVQYSTAMTVAAAAVAAAAAPEGALVQSAGRKEPAVSPTVPASQPEQESWYMEKGKFVVDGAEHAVRVAREYVYCLKHGEAGQPYASTDVALQSVCPTWGSAADPKASSGSTEKGVKHDSPVQTRNTNCVSSSSSSSGDTLWLYFAARGRRTYLFLDLCFIHMEVVQAAAAQEGAKGAAVQHAAHAPETGSTADGLSGARQLIESDADVLRSVVLPGLQRVPSGGHGRIAGVTPPLWPPSTTSLTTVVPQGAGQPGVRWLAVAVGEHPCDQDMYYGWHVFLMEGVQCVGMRVLYRAVGPQEDYWADALYCPIGTAGQVETGSAGQIQ